jgi:uncharacterized RDD family membrane protein YckC
MEHRPDIDESRQGNENSATAQVDSVDKTESAAPLDRHATPLIQTRPGLEATHDRAGFWLRVVAFVIDMTILNFFSLLLLLISILVSGLGNDLTDLTTDTEEIFPLFSLWIAGVLMASAAYFTILHSEYGQTIGKNLLGLEVRMRDGALPSYSQALFRCLAYGISASFFGLGFLWVAIHPAKRGWHDFLASTIVVLPKQKELSVP